MDILVALYGGVIKRDADDPRKRDRIILSKGHAAAALRRARGIRLFPAGKTPGLSEGRIALHRPHYSWYSRGRVFDWPSRPWPQRRNGLALAGRIRHLPYRVFTILSEGDCQEGATWEAAMFAAHHRLSSMVCIVDHNKIQNYGRVDEVLGLAPLDAKWEAAGWATRNVDGHDMGALVDALAAAPFEPDRPSALIAHTVKGKGVSFMEDQLKWHYQTPTADEVESARAELMS
ncbi:MAG: transketolase [Methylocystis sp.]